MVDIGELHMVVSRCDHTYEIMRIFRFGVRYEAFELGSPILKRFGAFGVRYIIL
jgi:hypothetical protein